VRTSHHWITGILALFCVVMTFLLIRSEYFPESSLLQKVPPEFVADRLLKHTTASSLKIQWKGEDIGSFNLRVLSGAKIRMNSLLDCDVPVLGRKNKLRVESFGLLRSDRQVERLFIRGRWQASAFELRANSENDQVVVMAKGDGVDIRREFRFKDLLQAGITDRMDAISNLPKEVPAAEARQIASQFTRWRVNAWNTRIHRFGDWMDAYLVSARLDDNWWFKLWISPTGELLRLDSSFGLRATNEDFFTPTG
jgi:hypothetical protein